MGEMCFAEPFGCLDQASATEWSTSVINVFVAATWTQGIRRISGVGTYLESLLTRLLVPRQAAAWRTIHLTNAREKTIKRLRAADDPSRVDHRDFIYQILNSSSSAKSLPLSETEIILNIALFISAGSDTTATALTGWTYFVCTHRDVYERLIREVREACPSAESDVVWSTVKDLRFLEATLLEALRLFPPSPASQQRMVPRGGAVIDGYALPEGTTVAVSPWSSTRSKLNFHDPDTFRPERWLTVDQGGQEEFASDRLGASLPFGTGPRVCIGKNLAHMEMRLIAAHMLRNFDMVLEERGDAGRANGVWGLDGNMKTMPVFHSMTKPPLWVRLTPVKG